MPPAAPLPQAARPLYAGPPCPRTGRAWPHRPASDVLAAVARKVLDRYFAGPGAFAVEALEAPTARDVVERLVRGAVELTTGPHTPHGCLSVNSVHACGRTPTRSARR